MKRLSAWNCLTACGASRRGTPSMSPASSAATRAAGSLMKRKVTLLQLDALGVAVAVPLGQRDRRALLPVVEGERARCRPAWWRWSRRSSGRGSRPCSRPGGTGNCRRRCSSVRITVCGSGVSMRAMLSNTAFLALLVLFSALARSKLNFTSAASKASPSWNLTPLLQLEGVALAVGVHAPALGQQRRDRAVDVDLGQAFEHVVVHDLADRRGRRDGRVQARRVRAPWPA